MDTPSPIETPAAAAPAAAPSGPLSAVDAQAKIDAIYADAKHPYHKGDAGAVEAMRGLFQQVRAR